MKLSEKEFDLVIEALEQLPSRSSDGNLMRRLMIDITTRGNEEAHQEAMDQLSIQEMKEEADRRLKKKAVGILIGKLYSMKDDFVE